MFIMIHITEMKENKEIGPLLQKPEVEKACQLVVHKLGFDVSETKPVISQN